MKLKILKMLLSLSISLLFSFARGGGGGTDDSSTVHRLVVSTTDGWEN